MANSLSQHEQHNTNFYSKHTNKGRQVKKAAAKMTSTDSPSPQALPSHSEDKKIVAKEQRTF